MTQLKEVICAKQIKSFRNLSVEEMLLFNTTFIRQVIKKTDFEENSKFYVKLCKYNHEKQNANVDKA